MIKTEELRIGSKVAMGDHHCTVNSIHTVPQTGECFVRISGYLDRYPQYQVYLYQLEPIPLTPEILEYCGFEKNGFGGFVISIMPWWNSKQPLRAIRIGSGMHGDNSGIFDVWDNEGGFYHATVDSLHKLQNLYFSLTGKELTYIPVTEKA